MQQLLQAYQGSHMWPDSEAVRVISQHVYMLVRTNTTDGDDIDTAQACCQCWCVNE